MLKPRHVRAVALATAALALVAAAGSAVLAAIPRVDVYVREACVAGPWPEGTSVTFTLRTAGGVLKDQQVGIADEDDLAFGCFEEPIVAGDRTRVKQGSSSRTLTALKLRLNTVDRVADQVKGKATSGRSLKLRVDRCRLGEGFNPDGCPDAHLSTMTVPGGGSYTFDTTGALDLRGRDLVEVILRNETGDRFRRGAVVPVYFVELHKAGISGVFPPGPPIEFQLLDEPGGSLIAAAALPSPGRSGVFRNGPDEVPIQPGNQIAGDFSIDAKMLVPQMITGVDPTGDAVVATCFAGRKYQLSIQGPDGGQVSGTAGAAGAIERDLTGTGIDIGPTSSVVLQCLAPTGDTISHRVSAD